MVDVVLSNGQISKIYGEMLEQPTRSYLFIVGNLRAAERGFFLMELDARAGFAIDGEIRLTLDDPRAAGRVTESLLLGAIRDVHTVQ